MAGANIEDTLLALDRVFYIDYPIWFKNNRVWTLIDSNGEVNVMTLIYAAKLGLKICRTNIGAQKIDDFTLKMFGMVLASFQVENQLRKAWFFQEIFLFADINVEVVLKMPFLTFNNADI